MYTESYLDAKQNTASNHNPGSANSILVADCGTIFTKVSLLGLVEGQYRLMARGEAPTTVSGPYNDITKGIIQAISEIEYVTGHHYVTDNRILSPQQPTGDGVDLFVAAISACGPIRVAVLGAVSSTLDQLAAQAVSGIYAETHSLASPTFVAASTPSSAAPVAAGMASPLPPTIQWTPERISLEWERQLEAMRELDPHTALIVGLADGPAGPTPLQEACQLIINAREARRENESAAHPIENAYKLLPVIYAGAPQYVEAVRRMLNGYSEVTRVEAITSPAQLGPVSMAVTALYERDVVKHIPGYQALSSWSPTDPVGTSGSLSSLVRFLAQHYAMNVAAVDIGGSTTTVMMAGERGEFIPMVNAALGMGPNIGAVLQQAGNQRITRWLPFAITEDELRQYVMNRMLHPQVIPTSTRDLQIGHAFARESILLTLETGSHTPLREFNADLILATGGVLAHVPKYSQALLLLLDALQPRGVTSIVLDRTMLIPQLGAVATAAPIAAVQVNENDAVMHRLGTCVVPFGHLPPGQVAIRVGLEYSNGRQVTAEVMTGSIEVIPLRVNEQALLTLYPAPSVDVGLGPGERARAAEEIDGGLVGLVIDARGRPLALPSADTERQARLLQWLQAIGA